MIRHFLSSFLPRSIGLKGDKHVKYKWKCLRLLTKVRNTEEQLIRLLLSSFLPRGITGYRVTST